MAVTLNNVKVKAGVVSMGDYVTAKGAGTLIDMGLTEGGFHIGPKRSYYDVDGDQYLGILDSVKTKDELEVKFVMKESDAQKLILAMSQPDANKTGTTPDFTVNVDPQAPRRLHQLKFSSAGGGVGTTLLREMTFWRAVIKAVDAIGYKKDGAQLYALTVAILQEITGSGTDNFYRQVDS